MPRIKKKVSMAVIAERMGISKNAVSLALSNKAGVSEELRAAVRKTAQELGYTHNPNGGGAEKSRNILLKEGSTVEELVKSLAAIGSTTRDVIAILESLRAAGALEAQLEVI